MTHATPLLPGGVLQDPSTFWAEGLEVAPKGNALYIGWYNPLPVSSVIARGPGSRCAWAHSPMKTVLKRVDPLDLVEAPYATVSL